MTVLIKLLSQLVPLLTLLTIWIARSTRCFTQDSGEQSRPTPCSGPSSPLTQSRCTTTCPQSPQVQPSRPSKQLSRTSPNPSLTGQLPSSFGSSDQRATLTIGDTPVMSISFKSLGHAFATAFASTNRSGRSHQDRRQCFTGMMWLSAADGFAKAYGG